MVLPLIAVGAVAGGAGAGWASGKAMQARGDALRNKALSEQSAAEQFVNKQQAEFEDARSKYLHHLRSLIYLAKSQIGPAPHVPPAADSELPEAATEFWKRLSERAALSAPHISSKEISLKADGFARGAMYQSSQAMRGGHPTWAALTAGMSMAAKGHAYWLACGSYLDEVRLWASQQRHTASDQVDRLKKDLADDIANFDSILPTISAAARDIDNLALAVLAREWMDKVEHLTKSGVA